MANGRLDGWSAPQGAALLPGQGLVLATVLAPDFAQDDAEDGALPFDGTPQAKELPGVRMAAGLAARFLAFLDEGLFQGEAHPPGGLHDPAPGDLCPAGGCRPDGAVWTDLG